MPRPKLHSYNPEYEEELFSGSKIPLEWGDLMSFENPSILNKKRGRPRKEQNILKARSDIKKSDSSKSGYVVNTQMNVRDHLTPKVKKALKLSLQEAIKQHIGV